MSRKVVERLLNFMAHFLAQKFNQSAQNEECRREVEVEKTTLNCLATASRAMVVDGYIKFNSHEITVSDVCD